MESDMIKQRVQQHFGAAAQSYVTSASHAHGDDLARMVALARTHGHEDLLDIATGGGHTALAFAPPHLSVYHLTLEPNTVFAHNPPALPDDDLAADMLDLLGSLYAETSRFPDAAATERKLLALVEKKGDPRMIAAVRAKIALYEAGRVE